MFSIKRLAAAVALAAAAGSAVAGLPSDLVLIVYDPVTTQTYIRDLGITSFADGQTLSSTADANWTSFFKAADAGQLKWSILGANTTSAVASGSTVYSSVLAAPATPTLTGLNALTAQSYGGIASVVGGTAFTGSFINTVTTSGADFNVIAQDANGLFGATQTGFGSLSLVKTSVGLRNALTTTNFTTTFALDSTGTLAAGAVTPPPAVPEPGTWALMVAGLLTVGAIARRRAV